MSRVGTGDRDDSSVDIMNVTSTSMAQSQMGDQKIMRISNFYTTLCKLKIKKSATECENLSSFLLE